MRITQNSVKAETATLSSARRIASSRASNNASRKTAGTLYLGLGLCLINVVAWGFTFSALIH